MYVYLIARLTPDVCTLILANIFNINHHVQCYVFFTEELSPVCSMSKSPHI